MSWAAQGVYEALYEYAKDKRQRRTWNIIPIGHFNRSIVGVSSIVGQKQVLRIASKLKLTKPYLGLTPWKDILVSLVLVFLTSLVAFGIEFLNNRAQTEEVINNPSIFGNTIFWVFVILSLAAGVGVRFLQTSGKFDRFDSEAKLQENLEAPKRHKVRDDFVKALAKKLHRGKPRIVIIDAFHRLDPESKLAIKEYLSKESTGTKGYESWIIFENRYSGTDQLSNWIVKEFKMSANKEKVIYEMQNISDLDKEQLAKALGENFPIKKFEKRIKYICQNDSRDEASIFSEFMGYRDLRPKPIGIYDIIDLIYFLSFNSYEERGALNPQLQLNFKYLYRNILNRKPLRSRLLAKMFPDFDFEPHIIRDRFDKAKKKFPQIFVQESLATKKKPDPNSFFIIPIVNKLLIDDPDAFDLPHPTFVHLYWSLFWGDKLRKHPDQAYWFDKLSYHLTRSEVAYMKGIEDFDQLYDNFTDYYVKCLEGCIKTVLLKKAQLLIEVFIENHFPNLDESQFTWAKSRKQRFLILLWELYLITLKPELLNVLPKLAPLPFESSSENPYAKFILDELFQDLIPN